jgi:hypothetical protein
MEKTTKTKVVGLKILYHFVVDNFFIRIHTFEIFKFKI